MKISLKKPEGVTAEYLTISFEMKQIRLLVIRPASDGRKECRPGVLWIHGGGYMLGMPEMAYMSRAADLAAKGGAVVVSPAYTLSFAAPYPRALLECHAVLVYMKEHASELGIRSDQIMVGGESAGGGLAAALCMYAKDMNTVRIAFQMPLYPMIDCFDTETSRRNNGKVWNTGRNHFAWKLYLRSLKGIQDIPEYASPSRRKDYSGLPPCYTFVGDIEPFYAETEAYVKNLQDAGTESQLDVYRGFYHAYEMLNPDDPRSVRAADRFLEVFREACRKYTAVNL